MLDRSTTGTEQSPAPPERPPRRAPLPVPTTRAPACRPPAAPENAAGTGERCRCGPSVVASDPSGVGSLELLEQALETSPPEHPEDQVAAVGRRVRLAEYREPQPVPPIFHRSSAEHGSSRRLGAIGPADQVVVRDLPASEPNELPHVVLGEPRAAVRS